MKKTIIGVWISNIGCAREEFNTKALRLVLEQLTKYSSGLSD